MPNKEWLITAHPYIVQRKDTEPEKKGISINNRGKL